LQAHRQSPRPSHLRKRTRSQGPFLSQHYPASTVIRPRPTPAMAAALRDVEAATLALDGSPPITRTTFPTCRALCLSQIKPGRICDAVRRGLGGKEYALPSQQYAIGANPYPRTGACASHYSSSYTIGAHGEDAARRTQQRGQGTPVGSSR